MRTHKTAFGALHTFVGVPYGHPRGYAPVFIGGGAHRHGTVGREGRDGNAVAVSVDARCVDVEYEILKPWVGDVWGGGWLRVDGRGPPLDGCVIDLLECVDSHLYGLQVALHHFATLVYVGRLDFFLKLRIGDVKRDYFTQI